MFPVWLSVFFVSSLLFPSEDGRMDGRMGRMLVPALSENIEVTVQRAYKGYWSDYQWYYFFSEHFCLEY